MDKHFRNFNSGKCIAFLSFGLCNNFCRIPILANISYIKHSPIPLKYITAYSYFVLLPLPLIWANNTDVLLFDLVPFGIVRA